MEQLDEEMGGDLGARIMQIAETMKNVKPPAFPGTQPSVSIEVSTRIGFMKTIIKSGSIPVPTSNKDMREVRDWADRLTKIALE
jgi:hypothetical protein